jgi:hypothetical protein
MERMLKVMDTLCKLGLTVDSAAAITRACMGQILHSTTAPEALAAEVLEWAKPRSMVEWAN